jgi:Raf kinase inhibitor-like YbhB/YbcL family protein
MKANNCRQRHDLFLILAILTVLCLVTMLLAGCGAGEQPPEEKGKTLSITSPAFQEGDKMPDKYTSQGEDISPPLAWSEPPEGTQSFVLIMDDPDAPGGTFTHWVIFNIPSNSRGLSEGVPTEDQLSDGTIQGKNDFDRIGYRGPSPPPGRAHRYKFTLYALEQSLDLKAGASKNQILDAIQEHILAQGELTGIYQR